LDTIEIKIEQFEKNFGANEQVHNFEEIREGDIMHNDKVEYFEASRDLASRNSSLTEPRGEGCVAAMYDSKTTEKPHLSTFAKALAVKKGKTSPIA
jgi:hypothetical protein